MRRPDRIVLATGNATRETGWTAAGPAQALLAFYAALLAGQTAVDGDE